MQPLWSSEAPRRSTQRRLTPPWLPPLLPARENGRVKPDELASDFNLPSFASDLVPPRSRLNYADLVSPAPSPHPAPSPADPPSPAQPPTPVSSHLTPPAPQPEAEPWMNVEDDLLLQLRSEGKSFAEIGHAVGRDAGLCSQRWNEAVREKRTWEAEQAEVPAEPASPPPPRAGKFVFTEEAISQVIEGHKRRRSYQQIADGLGGGCATYQVKARVRKLKKQGRLEPRQEEKMKAALRWSSPETSDPLLPADPANVAAAFSPPSLPPSPASSPRPPPPHMTLLNGYSPPLTQHDFALSRLSSKSLVHDQDSTPNQPYVRYEPYRRPAAISSSRLPSVKPTLLKPLHFPLKPPLLEPLHFPFSSATSTSQSKSSEPVPVKSLDMAPSGAAYTTAFTPGRLVLSAVASSANPSSPPSARMGATSTSGKHESSREDDGKCDGHGASGRKRKREEELEEGEIEE
ncbi:hypothetical protein JCM8097_008395 [Rhodosporidiobolus ruineniae]